MGKAVASTCVAVTPEHLPGLGERWTVAALRGFVAREFGVLKSSKARETRRIMQLGPEFQPPAAGDLGKEAMLSQ